MNDFLIKMVKFQKQIRIEKTKNLVIKNDVISYDFYNNHVILIWNESNQCWNVKEKRYK